MTNKIITSWEKNAFEWIKVIDAQQIPSRKITNAAILQMLTDIPSERILDIGCGEGWLTRSITKIGKQGVGLDAIGQLLENARQKGPESYYQMSYEDIMAGHVIPEAPYDVAVFNFCLYQKKGLPQLFQALRGVLSEKGGILVQTLHPYFLLNNGLEYKSQVITDSWKGLPGNFIEGHQWYARTFENWFSVFAKCHMKLVDLREITDGEGQAISVLFKAIQKGY